MTIITDSAELAAFCARQSSDEFIAVDTEFLRDNSYWPKLCLVQIAGPDEAAAIDTLAKDIDLAPLYELMRNSKLLKVFHAGRQDMEIFHRAMSGDLPHPIFDTQVAAMVCGFGDSVGYDTLVARLAGARIDKASRFTDWARRPLSKRQLDYALADVTHLRTVYKHLKQQLEKSGRAHWLAEEMSILTDPETYCNDPEEAWLRLKTRSNDRRYLSVLKQLAAWREREAQRRDLPRNRILRDEQLFDVAVHRPREAGDLARSRGFNKEVAGGRLGQAVLQVVADALESSEESWPKPPQRGDTPSGVGPVVEMLKVLLKMKCEEHDVAQKLVANSADLERIAVDDEADVPALKGWRREVFGNDALALKEGRLALSMDGKRVVAIDLRSRGAVSAA